MNNTESVRVFQSMDSARSAKEALKASLGHPEWLRGVGIGGSPEDGYHVKVNVASLTDEVRAQIPSRVNDIPVVVEAVGNIRGRS